MFSLENWTECHNAEKEWTTTFGVPELPDVKSMHTGSCGSKMDGGPSWRDTLDIGNIQDIDWVEMFIESNIESRTSEGSFVDGIAMQCPVLAAAQNHESSATGSFESIAKGVVEESVCRYSVQALI